MLINKTKIWQELQNLAWQKFQTSEIKRLNCANLTLDFSHQNINEDILDKLVMLALKAELPEKIQDLFAGKKVNFSENRPALHTALRAESTSSLYVDNINIINDIKLVKNSMQAIALDLKHKRWLGFSGKPIKHIINIGIGGSDLGPRFCIDAIKDYTDKTFSYYFISDVDPDIFESTVKNLDKEQCLFIVSSKSFTTPETLYQTKKAINWVGREHIARHFIAITANVEKAKSFGFKTILPIWNFIGGRYSFCSAINLISYIAMGSNNFDKILNGARLIDEHFYSTPLKENLPVVLGLLGVWNINFKSIHNHLILTYSTLLEKFTSYVQQLDMESNGKCITKGGIAVDYATGPIVWGGLGNQAQHSYYQLLCQGTHQSAIDFITIHTNQNQLINRMADAKMHILKNGVKNPYSKQLSITGRIPYNHITLQELTPESLGALIALYEHKIYVQSVIWDINPFDQPGVEAAKANSLKDLMVN